MLFHIDYGIVASLVFIFGVTLFMLRKCGDDLAKFSRRERVGAARNVAFYAVGMLVATMIIMPRLHARSALGDVASLVGSVLAMDLVYFVAHFASHKLRYLKRSHLFHHKKITTGRLHVLVQGKFDFAGPVVLIVLIPLLFGMSAHMYIAWLTLNQIGALIGHDGPGWHMTHHKVGDVNYGWFYLVDRVVGTYQRTRQDQHAG